MQVPLLYETWQKLLRYDQMVGIGKIARRYFVVNAFDGTLTVMGLILGSWLAGVQDAAVVLKTGYSTALAIGVSGMWGAYMTEAAERRDDLIQLSRQTLTDLRDTDHWRATRTATIIVAVVNGLSPSLAASFVLIPFFFVYLLEEISWCYCMATLLAFTSLFVLGVLLGRVSGEKHLLSGIKMLAAGVVIAALSYLIGRI
ncbi:MAG TPA: hypothetical protein EYP57_00055 [Thermodesulfobacteriaceae bacterium]|nr:hypothetical protein [Thermodesulfobacteriaceae bacterium]